MSTVTDTMVALNNLRQDARTLGDNIRKARTDLRALDSDSPLVTSMMGKLDQALIDVRNAQYEIESAYDLL